MPEDYPRSAGAAQNTFDKSRHVSYHASTMAGNWEEEQLQQSLSRRVSAGWGAYWVASAQTPPPVPPITFTGGIPDPKTLPIDELVAASERVLRLAGPEALRYGGHQGVEPLRDWLAQRYAARDGLPLTAEHFTITNGISGGIMNVCDTFLDENDVGLSEIPTFPGGAGVIRRCLADLVGVPLDQDGLIPEALEETVERLEREGRRVKLLYTIPNFQNPTGSCLTLERRHAVVDICRRYGIMIMEDDAYGDIRFEQDVPPSLFALAGGKGVVHLGTFSKTVATGLRVGWTIADAPVTEALLRTRFDLGCSPWVQLTMLEFVRDGRFEAHVEDVCRLYERKRDIMLSALRERCAKYLSWNEPGGGYFLWLTLAENIDAKLLADAAREMGVQYVGGAGFHRGGGGSQQVRLAFSFVDEEQIPEGIIRLGRALDAAARA
jgi:DNA-binding transcriptional MocR family regulator